MQTLSRPGSPDIGYDVTGDGPPLLLIHGITESAASWDPLLPHLAADHRVVRVDLRGHGSSAPAPTYALDDLADDVAAVAQHVGADRPLVVGHSLGGFVATVLAAAHPTRGVVNLDQPLALPAFQAALAEVEPALRSDGFSEVIAQMFAGYTAPLPPEEAARLESLRRADPHAVLGIWDPVLTRSAEDLDALVRQLVGGVDVPYLAVHGEDPGTAYRSWLEEIIPQAVVEVVPDAAHYPHLYDPEGFLARLRRFEADLA